MSNLTPNLQNPSNFEQLLISMHERNRRMRSDSLVMGGYCKNGHLLDETTAGVIANGSLRCKTCGNASAQRGRHKNRKPPKPPVTRVLYINSHGEVTIGLTKGFTAVVDGVDIALATRLWTAQTGRNYPVRNSSYLHKLILERIVGRQLTSKDVCDHVNGNPLDNRRRNLRLATSQQNLFNQGLSSANRSGHTGVYYNATDKRWRAQIKINQRCKHLGSFKNIEDAIAVRRQAEIELFGEFSATLSRKAS